MSDGYWIVQACVSAIEDRIADQQPSWLQTNVRISMTHVSKWIHHHMHIHQKDPETKQYVYYPGIPRCALDASHLCHNSECLNPDHIIFEPHSINMNRNMCKRKQTSKGTFEK